MTTKPGRYMAKYYRMAPLVFKSANWLVFHLLHKISSDAAVSNKHNDNTTAACPNVLLHYSKSSTHKHVRVDTLNTF